MRKIFYLLTALGITLHANAQNATAAKNQDLLRQIKVVNNQSYTVHRNIIDATPIDNNVFYKQSGGARAGGDVVGYTSYDLVTNGCSPNHLLVYPDGKVSAVYTGSTNTTDARPDRGTFYNTYDGSTWGTLPTSRIEDIRTGFPALINVGDHEMYFAHDGNNNIVIFENESIGSNDWTENPNSLLLHGTWPRAAASEGSNYVHLLAANNDPSNTNNYMLYYRSSDNGATWDIQELRLPGIDTASGISVMGGECYVMRVIGSNVYIAAGESITDLSVWKSTSNGDIGSWTRTRLIDFEFDNFDGNEISDITGDGVADTLPNHDGAIALAIDNDGMMHVWTGVTRILDVEAGDNAWTYFPGTTGMWYWNETFGADSVQYLDFTLVDWDEDGDPFLGIGANLPNYGCGFTSQPSATVDPETGNLYVVYTHPVEFTDYFGDPTVETAESFRDLFGFYSTDNGVSWSTPINLSYTADLNFENVVPTVYWSTTNDKVHVMWMQDQEPGNSLETEAPDPITTENAMLYRAFDYNRFEPYDPTAEYDYTGATNVLSFTNLSVDADAYSWNFGDGGSSVIAEPTHIFPAIGTYLVCLNAENKYGEDQNCKTIEITQVTGIEEPTLNELITVYPTLSAGSITINVTDFADDIQLSVLNINGQQIKNATIIGGKTTIDLSDLAAGEYMLRFISRSSVAIKQISLIK